MNTVIRTLISKLIDLSPIAPEIIPWASPVPCFGNLYTAQIATLGLNPSNREFVDNRNIELSGKDRRFQTLTSLGFENWSRATEEHINVIWQSCEQYFLRNPYDEWFGQLDCLISGTQMSYYPPLEGACHLDLIPYATAPVWGELARGRGKFLLTKTKDLLGGILDNSQVRVIILNGQTVVDTLKEISNVNFELA